jgi:hypothetical protein
MNAQEATAVLAGLDGRRLDPTTAADEAMAVYLALGAEIDALQEARAAAKQVVADVFAETGVDRLETASGFAYTTKPSIRVSYDTKGLDALCASLPQVASLLRPHRTEKEVPAVLTIRAAK